MFVSGPPSGRANERGALRFCRAERRTFAGAARFLLDPAHRAAVGTYLSEMVRPYGISMPPDRLDEGPRARWGQSYGEMGEALIGALVTDDDPVDLLVLAFAIHDLRPGRATATYLSGVCPGNPMAFAVCDQGSAAMFTAMRIARDYGGSAGCRCALLIVVEQATLPYRVPAVPVTVPAEHRGVAFLCAAGTDGTDAPDGADAPAGHRLHAVRQHTDVRPDDVADLVAAEAAALGAGQPDARLVLSATLARIWDRYPRDRTSVAPAGQPATGVWWELAGALSVGIPGRVVVGDYDPDLRYVCMSAIDAG